jgi:vanadium-dependent haloperoxidase-like protein
MSKIEGSKAVAPRYRMLGLLLVALAVVVAVAGGSSPSAQAVLPALPNTIQQWNKIAEDTVVGSGAFQGEGEIYMSYASLAVYDAVVAIQGGSEPYGPAINAPAGASVDAAVVEAAYRTLSAYFPSSCNPTNAACMALGASLLTNYNLAMAAIPAGPAKASGSAVGLAAANSIIALRAGDGRLTPIGTTSSFETKDPAPGVWRLTPPAFLVPQTPWLGSVQPFLLKSPGQFQPEPPIPLTSKEWARQFNEVKSYGSATSAVRTSDQTATAWFYTANVIRQFNIAARDLATARALDTRDTARLLAMVNTVSADALMSVLNAKYQFLFWRPVTAIAGGGVCPSQPSAVTTDGYGPVPGFDDGNAETVEDPCWRPLVTTPNHPEYPAAHGTNTSAMAEVFAEFLGTDQIDLDIRGFDAAGAAGNFNAVHHFDTAAQLREEVIGARLWGGIHYRRSSEVGVHLGQKVAHFGLNHAFKTTG